MPHSSTIDNSLSNVSIEVDVRIDPPPDEDAEPEPCLVAKKPLVESQTATEGLSKETKPRSSSLDLESDVQAAVRAAAAHRGFRHGSVGVWVTDDEHIHQVNRQSLSHDYPTDVISFDYREATPVTHSGDADDCSGAIDGELIVSHQTARMMADRHGVDARSELLMYVIHGTLHITGMNDVKPADRLAMRTAETEIMRRLNFADADRMRVDDDSHFDNGLDAEAGS